MSSPDEEPKLLPLEVDIPKEHLPEVLHVYDKESALLKDPAPPGYRIFQEDDVCMIPPINMVRRRQYRHWLKFLDRCPVKYVRKYPAPVPTKDEGTSIPAPPSIRSPLSTFAEVDCTTGRLDLSLERRLSSSNHSYVFLAPLTLSAPSLRGEVAVKLAKARRRDHEMLENEAMIYDEFPCELQQSTPSSPPVVPKFFGYYTPCCDSADSYVDKYDEEDVQGDVRWWLEDISPILLLEPCGKPIKANVLSSSNR
jgi:hypothetical protein